MPCVILFSILQSMHNMQVSSQPNLGSGQHFSNFSVFYLFIHIHGLFMSRWCNVIWRIEKSYKRSIETAAGILTQTFVFHTTLTVQKTILIRLALGDAANATCQLSWPFSPIHVWFISDSHLFKTNKDKENNLKNLKKENNLRNLSLNIEQHPEITHENKQD